MERLLLAVSLTLGCALTSTSFSQNPLVPPSPSEYYVVDGQGGYVASAVPGNPLDGYYLLNSYDEYPEESGEFNDLVNGVDLVFNHRMLVPPTIVGGPNSIDIWIWHNGVQVPGLPQFQMGNYAGAIVTFFESAEGQFWVSAYHVQIFEAGFDFIDQNFNTIYSNVAPQFDMFEMPVRIDYYDFEILI